jgi:hypothetical protein
MSWKHDTKILLKKLLILKEMKLSNKLLIAFASALILIPILGMVYVSQVKYKVGTYADVVERKIENFSTTTKNMTSVALSTPFKTVNVEDAKGYSIGIRFIKDEKFGIKIPSEYKDVITATVDANGELQLVLKSRPEENRNNYTSILVYAPSLKEVNIAKASGTYIIATLDSLIFNVKASVSAGVGAGAHIKNLSINTIDVGEVRLVEDDVKSLSLNLHNTNFSTNVISYDNLSISTSGNCDVNIFGGDSDNKKYTINNLALNTIGKANVKLNGIEAKNCSGHFSDETIVQMPASNLNQMFKK